MGEKQTILIVGVYADGRIHGGICSVIDQYMHSSIADRYRLIQIGNSSEGGTFAKLVAFFRGCASLACRCAFSRVSLVHIHTASGTSFYRKSVCFFIALLFRKKVLMHIHGGGFLDFYGHSACPVRLLVRQVLDHADHIIVLSERFRVGLQTITRNQNLTVLHNPIRASAFSVKTLNERLPGSILFMGDIIERKGIADLIEAMPKVLERIPGAKLHLCGRGSINFYRSICAEKGLSGSILFERFLSGDARLAAFSSASLFVLPSYIEGMPMVIIEAMAAGLPIVATSVGGIPEIIEEGKNGFLISPHDVAALVDRIVGVLSDFSLSQSMNGANKAKAAEEFDIAAIAPKLCALYERIIGGQPAGQSA